MSLTISAIAVLLFSAYLLFDVGRIVNGGETNYVMATMTLFLDLYNIFISLLNLLMAFTGPARLTFQHQQHGQGGVGRPFFASARSRRVRHRRSPVAHRRTARSTRRARCAGTC